MTLIQGCTVGWHSLKKTSPSVEKQIIHNWECPAKVGINLKSSVFTNTFGEQNNEQKSFMQLKSEFENTTNKILMAIGCELDSRKSSGEAQLVINITERAHISALPQEWLTGLSFGLIPSWGTRFGEYTYEFIQGDHSETYTVDDIRVNHILLFPIFWLSFLLMNPQLSYEKALLQFIGNAQEKHH